MKPTIRPLISLAILGSTVALADAAWAVGTLSITNVQKLATSFTVTGTCVQGPVPVKLKLQETSTGAVTTIAISNACGATAATTGKTVTVPLSSVPAGTYIVALKQGSGNLAYWQVGGVNQTITLP